MRTYETLKLYLRENTDAREGFEERVRREVGRIRIVLETEYGCKQTGATYVPSLSAFSEGTVAGIYFRTEPENIPKINEYLEKFIFSVAEKPGKKWKKPTS